MMVLRAYQRLVAVEVAKGEAVVEHAGAVDDAMLAAIAASMTRKYGRPVTATAKPNPALLAGLRVHVGDDIYESSIAGQLAALASSV
jgi:F-type H+-transporting ATPase subunit delta